MMPVAEHERAGLSELLQKRMLRLLARPSMRGAVSSLLFTVAAVVLVLPLAALAAEQTNYDESRVPEYTLPDPLVLSDGSRVADSDTWVKQRRVEVFQLFESQVYGRCPPQPVDLRFETVSEDSGAFGGLATRKVIRIRLAGDRPEPSLRLVLFAPNNTDQPVPAFVGLRLFPLDDDDPNPGKNWVQEAGGEGASEQHAANLSAPLPGNHLGEAILRRGYAFASLDPGDFAPDDAERFTEGVVGYLAENGQHPHAPDSWGALAAWGWGLSRAIDYFETDDAIDHARVMFIGHSRMGKTALWAAARDQRAAAAISNNSGCGGAALSRRRFGETVERINVRFPHWFCDNFDQYNDHEDRLPVDQHMLVSLIAPRPVYIASAVDDGWADPRGEFLSAMHAGPVYKLFGCQGVGVSEMPPPGKPVGDTVAYHIRAGRHALTDYDWLHYLDFADRHLAR